MSNRFGCHIGVLNKGVIRAAQPELHIGSISHQLIWLTRSSTRLLVGCHNKASFHANPLFKNRQFNRFASTVNNNEYDIDLITLTKKEKTNRTPKQTISSHSSNTKAEMNLRSDAKESLRRSLRDSIGSNNTGKEFNAPMGYKYFSKKYSSELSIFLKYLMKIDFSKKAISNKVDIENTFRNFKLRYQFGDSKHGKEANIASISSMVTGFKRNPELFEYFIFNNLGLDLRSSSVEPEDAEEFVSKEEVIIDESPNANELFGTDKEPIKDGSSKIGSLLHKSTGHNNVISPKNFTEEQHQSKSFKDLLVLVSKSYKDVKSDKQDDLLTYTSSKVELNSSLDKAIKEKNNRRKHDSTKTVAIGEIENYLGAAKMKHDAIKDNLFKAEKAYTYSRSMLGKRSLDTGNFFTPVCIPNTLIPTSLITSYPSNRSKILQNTLFYPNSEPEFCVLLNKGEVIKSKQNPIGNFFVPEDIFTIFSKLEHPESHIKKVNKLQNKGWKLIGGGGNKQMLVFERPFVPKRVLIYEKLKSVFALAGLFFVSMIIFYSYSRKERKSQNSTQTESHPILGDK